LVVSVLHLIRRSRIAGALELLPFHDDAAGGLGFVASIVSGPVIVSLLAVSIPAAAALQVHRRLDVTPLIGLGSLLGFALVAYFFPILRLRTDIRALKKALLRRLRARQELQYKSIISSKRLDDSSVTHANDALVYFDSVCARVQSIPNFPHWSRFL